MQTPAADTNDIAALKAIIASMQHEMDYLRWQLAKARQERFGRSSERGDLLNQLALYQEAPIPVDTPAADTVIVPSKARAPRQPPHPLA